MTIKNIFNEFLSIIKTLINMHGKGLSYEEVPEYTTYIKYSIATYNILLFLFIFLNIINFIINIFFNNNKIILKIL